MPPKKQKPAYVPNESEHRFPTAAELGVTNQASKKKESYAPGCPGFDDAISTLDFKIVGCEALLALPCSATSLKGVCKRPYCKSLIEQYLTVEEWNAHLALHTMTPRNLVSINDSADQLRMSMAKKYYASMSKLWLSKVDKHHEDKANIEAGLVETATEFQQKLQASQAKSLQAANDMKALHGGNLMAIGHQATPMAIGHQATPKQTYTISELPDSAKNEAGLRVLADFQQEIKDLKQFAYGEQQGTIDHLIDSSFEKDLYCFSCLRFNNKNPNVSFTINSSLTICHPSSF